MSSPVLSSEETEGIVEEVMNGGLDSWMNGWLTDERLSVSKIKR